VVDSVTSKGKITVLFSDGKSSVATIIGRDESYDLAVLRVSRRNLPVLVLGHSSAVVVGDPVIAVGAPLGLDSTVTSGIVSALNRPVTAGGAGASSASFINAVQTDAAINPGNSGGPLLDMAGRVIGVNSAIARVASSQDSDGQSGNIGVGFAIPSDQVRKTAEQLIASGKATHPVIGVLIDTTYKGEGVRIAASPQNGSPPITKGGPADKAGLRPGDTAKVQLREQMGSEFDDVDWKQYDPRQYDPRRIVREALMDEGSEDGQPSTSGDVEPEGFKAPSSFKRHDPDKPTPYDEDAT
jgi:putative serine protease PepD